MFGSTKKWKFRMKNAMWDARANLRGLHSPIEAHVALNLPKLKKKQDHNVDPGSWSRVALQNPIVRSKYPKIWYHS